MWAMDSDFARGAYGRGYGKGFGRRFGGPGSGRYSTLPQGDFGNVCKTPGMKIRSQGKGRGLARGRGMGPVGVPVGFKW